MVISYPELMKVEPGKEHQWLRKLLGEWTFEAEAQGKPGEPIAKFKGAETVRAVGDIWVVADGQGEMPGGGTGKTMMTLGYDPERKHYVGTWLGSMMTHLWVYEGELDEAERVLTLNTEGPAMSGAGTAKYRDVIEFRSDDQRLLTAHLLSDDGTWQRFMTTTYQRRK
jgi:hypothetical protein